MATFQIIESSVNTKIDRVSIAIVAIDAFTGEPIREGLVVTVDGLVKQAIRNLSGMYVFINLPERPQYSVTIDGSAAGYFNPEAILFNAGDAPRVDVPLNRRPTKRIDFEATLFAGTVIENIQGDAAVYAKIEASFPEEDGATTSLFSTYSDEKGAFLLPCRVPDLASDDQRVVTLTFSANINGLMVYRKVTRKLLTASFLTFDQPVLINGPDIDVNDSGPLVPSLIEGAK